MVYVKLLKFSNKRRYKTHKMEVLCDDEPDPVSHYLRQWGLEMYIEHFKEHAIDLDTLQMFTDYDLKELIPLIGHRAKLNTQIKMLRTLTAPRDSLATQESELYSILCACNEGKSLLLRFQETGLLNNASRRKLCNLIISHELKDSPDKKINSSRLYLLAFEISRVFTKENSSVYFIPFMTFNPRQKTSAKGKLLDCYRQRRREFIKHGIAISTKKRQGSTSTSSEADSPHTYANHIIEEAVHQLQETSEDVDEKLIWLKNCCDPWATVELYWDMTSKKRLMLLTSTEITVENYLRDFKPLNQPGGVFLLLKDFKVLYPHNENKINENWPLIASKIIEEAKKRQDVGLKEILNQINYNDDEVHNLVAFMVLPFLMTTSIVKTKSAKQWRPSKHEALQGFICHVKSAAEIDETITRRKAKLQELKLTLQPFIMVVGATLKEISTRYIIVNNIRYEMTSIVKAVDACFKIIFVLNAEYSAESRHVWQFIQKAVYNLSTKYDKIFTTVHSLSTDLGLNF